MTAQPLRDGGTMVIPDSGDPQDDPIRPTLPGPAAPRRLFRGVDIVWAGVILLLAQLVPGIIAGLIAGFTGAVTSTSEAMPSGLLLSAIAGSGVVMFLGVAWLRRRRNLSWANINVRPAGAIWAYLIAIVAFVGYLVAFEALAQSTGIDPEGELARELAGQLVPASSSPLFIAAAILFIGILVPAAEELLFRGVLLSWLHERTGGNVAVILSALAFAIIHFYFAATELQFGLFITGQIFVLGLLLGWLTLWSGSIGPAVFLHVVNNVFVTVVAIWC